jgi:lipopolysaccharide biosynthesis protein
MQNVVCAHDVFVSVRGVNDLLIARDFFAEHQVNAFVYVHRNVGRDVGPFMSLLGTGILDRYVAVCKIHSKKSVYHAQGGAWRNDLLKALLGSSHQVLRIVQAFRDSETCGMIGPELAYVSDARFWGGNEARLRILASELGIAEESVRLGFFAGTMFWIRPGALRTLRSRSLSLSDFEVEQGQRDATLAHVIERILTLCAIHDGYYLSSTRAPGMPLVHERYAKQGVLVLPS